MKSDFVVFLVSLLVFFSCKEKTNDDLICINKEGLEICLLDKWVIHKTPDYFLFAKLPNQNDFFAINFFDNPDGDQMFFDYLTGTHERFFYPEFKLFDYSIHEFVNNDFRYLYSVYEFYQEGEKVKFISITFNLDDVFYDIAIRINANNSFQVEDQFRKLVVPSLKLNGKIVFDLKSDPEKITEISAEPLDSLLMK